MARQVRIEFPGAFYHVMARGNRRDPIFVSPDGADEELFLKTLGETCERNGFVIWAWVLMRNHYHLVVETPKANLVDGMAWLQNAYTRRFNVRHKQWGRLFGDRYKSVLIDDDRSGGGSSYLATLLDYVHLNPARASLVRSSDGGSLLDYLWSSLSRGYALSPNKRPKWLRVAHGMELFGFSDKAADRRKFVQRLDERAATEEAERCGLAEIEGQSPEQHSPPRLVLGWRGVHGTHDAASGSSQRQQKGNAHEWCLPLRQSGGRSCVSQRGKNHHGGRNAFPSRRRRCQVICTTSAGRCQARCGGMGFVAPHFGATALDR